MRAFTPKGWTRPILTSDNPNLKQWRQLVADAAGEVATGEMFTEAIVLSLVFYLPPPKSKPKAQVYPTKRPDLSKLVRSTEDALKGVLWLDDSQIVDLLVRKRYSGVGAPTGVFVTVEEPGAHFARANLSEQRGFV